MKYTEDLFSGYKSATTKRQILSMLMTNDASTIVDLAKESCLSVPTITKYLDELIKMGLIMEYGKLETEEGRRPSLYGLNPSSGYFLGVSMAIDGLELGLINVKGELVHKQHESNFHLENNVKSLECLISKIKEYIDSLDIAKDKLMNVCIAIPGRVNKLAGYSFSYFCSGEKPLADYISEEIGYSVNLINDSHAMAFGEYMRGCVQKEKDILFFNVSWGLGLGIIIDGKLYMGKSGYSGEIGHTHAYNNQIICQCGKKGCLETEISGQALVRKVVEKLKEGENSFLRQLNKDLDELTLDDVLDAAFQEDTLAIDVLEGIGHEMGKIVANMINIFNPEIVIIGGTMSVVGEYLLGPITTAVRKHSLNLVNKDTSIKISKLKQDACVIGACMLARKNIFQS